MPQVTVDDITLHYREDGPADGTAAILLHAFPLAGVMWSDQAEILADELGCRVIVPDLRGFGDSAVPPGPYTMDLYAHDILALVDAIHLDQFVLGGLSMGGYVALAIMRLAPERVRGLILADTRAGADSDATRASREELAQRAEAEGAMAVAEMMLPRLLSPAALAHNPTLVNSVRASITSNLPTAIAAASRGMAQRPSSIDLLPQITCPTLILVGEEDTTTPPSEAQIMFEHLPQATLATISGAGHLSNLEAPSAFAEPLLHFMHGLVASS